MTQLRNLVDWAAVRLECVAGNKSARQVAREHGISHTAVQKRAKAEKWGLPFSSSINATVEMLVAATTVASVTGNPAAAVSAAEIEKQHESNSSTRVEPQAVALIAQAAPLVASKNVVAKVSCMVSSNTPEQVAGEVAGSVHKKGTAESVAPNVGKVHFDPNIGNGLTVHLDLEGRPMKGVDQEGCTIWRVL